MFDNPRTTIFSVLTSLFCILVAFTPFTSVVDLANFSQTNNLALPLAVVAIVLALDALLVVFFGLEKSKKAIQKLKKQYTFNKILSFSLLVYIVAFAVIIYLNNYFETPSAEWAFPPLAFITSLLAGNSLNGDIKTLRSEDRLR